MEVRHTIRGHSRIVYQPDAITLEQHPLRFRNVGHNPVWEAPHPALADVTLEVWRDYSNGRIRLAEKALIEVQYGRKVHNTLTVFSGWCYTANDWESVLALVGWQQTPPTS
jgi:hypothetical protein